jgi:nitroimidazol reductase NimA-like FMN-containing flavoprotein (pyridoxamine 5'-phosphate oxidase superfamily)
VYSILDEGFICHAACERDGTVWMIPTIYGRRDDRLLLHGAAANHVLNAAAGGAELTVTVTLVDGLVLARSTFHHSINYRSVVVFGRATVIDEPAEKAAALGAIVDHLLPGRTGDARAPNMTELASTRVLWLPLNEVSAKVRTGGPIDDAEDMDLPVWAGVIPMGLSTGIAQPDPAGQPGLAVPTYLSQPARWLGGA